MKKAYIGVRLKRLREEKRLTQAAVAAQLGISLSYLNQLENNQRPVTVSVLLALSSAFGVEFQLLGDDEEARLLSDLREVLQGPDAEQNITLAEVRELALNMPAVGRVLISLSRKYRHAAEQAATLAVQLGGDRETNRHLIPSAPYEEVRDFFYKHHNYIGPLDEAAEQLSQQLGSSAPDIRSALTHYLARELGVKVVLDRSLSSIHRKYDAGSKTLYLSSSLKAGQQSYQLGTQIALLRYAGEIDRLVEGTALDGGEAAGLARIGLANYFAGALIMPYGSFLNRAQTLHYDIDILSEEFGVGFETICHRLSTLQRPGSRGIPFFFIRVDRAGNISKRQSATDFHFSRVGGTCPLWNVYEAFARPGRILTQHAGMPDGRRYLWIARTVSQSRGGYGSPSKTFAIGLGCDVRYASDIIYSKGLDLSSPDSATPIGVGCKVCERPDCPQRAFPPIGKPLQIDETQARFTLYSS